MKPVLIHWDDSISRHGWVHHDDVPSLGSTLIKTLGYLVHEHEDSVIVSPSISENYVDSPIRIPRNAIINMWEIHIP